MGSLMASLLSTANSMRVYERSLNVIQNNISNASTPGYAKQRQILEAKPFDPAGGIPGGVQAGEMYSYRSRFVEQTVQRRVSDSNRFSQLSEGLERLEPLFQIQKGAGVPAALSQFFAGFSQLSVAPNDAVARQVALDRASTLAERFRQMAGGLADQRTDTDSQILSGVTEINSLATRLAQLNTVRRASSSARSDPGVETEMYNLLEKLASVVDYQAVEAPDGSMSVFIGGSTLLVIGDRTYPVGAGVYGRERTIVNSDGEEITRQISGGRLGGLLETYNTIIPRYLDELDGLAQSVADSVNDTLTQGVDQGGSRPTVPLFSYDTSVGVAISLRANALEPEDLALALPSAPGGNGNALVLAGLGAQKQPDGYTFAERYGNLAAGMGRDLEASRDNASTQASLLNQARALREDEQMVSLDEEAAQLIQFQRAYQAAARMFQILNEMTIALVNIGN